MHATQIYVMDTITASYFLFKNVEGLIQHENYAYERTEDNR